MPLLVHCPNHCRIHVPADRADKVVRCTRCESLIKIPVIDSPLLPTGNWVECRAEPATKKNTASDSDRLAHLSEIPKIQSLDPETLPPPNNKTPLLRAKPWRTVEPLTLVDPEDIPNSIELNLAPQDSDPAPPDPAFPELPIDTNNWRQRLADDGWIAGMIGVPFVLSQPKNIWCVITVCVATAIGFWAVKNFPVLATRQTNDP